MKTIKQEQKEAVEKYGHFNSTHEVYGVLKEEVDEFWELVKLNNDPKKAKYTRLLKKNLMIKELTQIAAVAQRTILELENNQIKWV